MRKYGAKILNWLEIFLSLIENDISIDKQKEITPIEWPEIKCFGGKQRNRSALFMLFFL